MRTLALMVGLMAGVAMAQTGDDIQTKDEEVKIDKDRFKDEKIKDLLTPNDLEPEYVHTLPSVSHSQNSHFAKIRNRVPVKYILYSPSLFNALI